MGAGLSPDESARAAAAAWLADAIAELATARSLSIHRDEGTAPFAAAFHAQQAVEKGLKAVLIFHDVAFPPRHDIGLLLGLLPAGSHSKALPVAGLTVYAVEQRYASGFADPMALLERPTWDEADDAIAAATASLEAIAADLDGRPQARRTPPSRSEQSRRPNPLAGRTRW
jgi:HEPN domain-containing protein